MWRERLGHGKLPEWAHSWYGGPLRLHRRLIYDPRPDLLSHTAGPRDWEQLQSPSRFFQSLACAFGPPGHIVYNIRWPLAVVMSFSVFTAIFEYLRTCCYPELPNLDPNSIQKQIFGMTSFIVSLLLSTRLSRAYDRWWLGCQGYGRVLQSMRTLVQLAAVATDDAKFQDEALRWGCVYAAAAYQAALSLPALPPTALGLLSRGEAALYAASPNPPFLVLTRLRQLVQRAELSSQLSGTLEAAFSGLRICLRVKSNPMPLSLSLLSTGIVFMWLMMLPFAVWLGDGWLNLVNLFIMFVVATLMLGIDEAANQLEYPFLMMPMEAMLSAALRDMHGVPEEARALAELEAAEGEGPGSEEKGDLAELKLASTACAAGCNGIGFGDGDTCIPI